MKLMDCDFEYTASISLKWQLLKIILFSSVLCNVQFSIIWLSTLEFRIFSFIKLTPKNFVVSILQFLNDELIRLHLKNEHFDILTLVKMLELQLVLLISIFVHSVSVFSKKSKSELRMQESLKTLLEI